MSQRNVLLVLGVSLVILSGCADPPQEKIDQVQKGISAARDAEAVDYAPEAMQAAVDAQKNLEVELAAQQERWSVRRSYKRAEELAAEADQKAAAAVSAAQAARAAAREQATTGLAALQTSLDDTTALLASAPKGKGSKADLDALRSDLDGVVATVPELEGLIAAEQYKEAVARVEAAQGAVATVRGDVERAIELASKKPARRG